MELALRGYYSRAKPTGAGGGVHPETQSPPVVPTSPTSSKFRHGPRWSTDSDNSAGSTLAQGRNPDGPRQQSGQTTRGGGGDGQRRRRRRCVRARGALASSLGRNQPRNSASSVGFEPTARRGSPGAPRAAAAFVFLPRIGHRTSAIERHRAQRDGGAPGATGVAPGHRQRASTCTATCTGKY